MDEGIQVEDPQFSCTRPLKDENTDYRGLNPEGGLIVLGVNKRRSLEQKMSQNLFLSPGRSIDEILAEGDTCQTERKPSQYEQMIKLHQRNRNVKNNLLSQNHDKSKVHILPPLDKETYQKIKERLTKCKKLLIDSSNSASNHHRIPNYYNLYFSHQKSEEKGEGDATTNHRSELRYLHNSPGTNPTFLQNDSVKNQQEDSSNILTRNLNPFGIMPLVPSHIKKNSKNYLTAKVNLGLTKSVDLSRKHYLAAAKKMQNRVVLNKHSTFEDSVDDIDYEDRKTLLKIIFKKNTPERVRIIQMEKKQKDREKEKSRQQNIGNEFRENPVKNREPSHNLYQKIKRDHYFHESSPKNQKHDSFLANQIMIQSSIEPHPEIYQKQSFPKIGPKSQNKEKNRIQDYYRRKSRTNKIQKSIGNSQIIKTCSSTNTNVNVVFTSTNVQKQQVNKIDLHEQFLKENEYGNINSDSKYLISHSSKNGHSSNRDHKYIYPSGFSNQFQSCRNLENKNEKKSFSYDVQKSISFIRNNLKELQRRENSLKFQKEEEMPEFENQSIAKLRQIDKIRRKNYRTYRRHHHIHSFSNALLQSKEKNFVNPFPHKNYHNSSHCFKEKDLENQNIISEQKNNFQGEGTYKPERQDLENSTDDFNYDELNPLQARYDIKKITNDFFEDFDESTQFGW